MHQTSALVLRDAVFGSIVFHVLCTVSTLQSSWKEDVGAGAGLVVACGFKMVVDFSTISLGPLASRWPPEKGGMVRQMAQRIGTFSAALCQIR